MPYIPIPPVIGPPEAPDHSWEGYHFHEWSEFDTFEGKYKYMQVRFEVPPPVDKLVSGTMLLTVLEDVFFAHMHEGAPLRYICWYKADREWGIPYLWHYAWHIEYHESPALPVAALIAALAEVLVLAIVFAVTLKLVGTGIIDKVGGSIIVPSVMGMGLIFVLGIGFIVVLANVVPGLTARTTMPHIPGVPKTEIGVGRAGAAARRRG